MNDVAAVVVLDDGANDAAAKHSVGKNDVEMDDANTVNLMVD